LPGFNKLANSMRWSAPGLRALYWPNGVICWQVNVYLLFCRRSGKAVSTINTYASELSIFVRYIYSVGTRIEDVCDDVLIDYSDWLVSRGRGSGSHINRLILRVITFLQWYQHLIIGRYLVGGVGQGAQVTVSILSKGMYRGAVRDRVRHHSMVPISIPRVVRPISTAVISNLLDACYSASGSNFKRARDSCIIILMADTGIRREELTWIRCEDVANATSNGGIVQVRTSKRRGNPYREIPISGSTVRKLVEYLDVSRAVQLRKLKRKINNFKDEGWAFCTLSGKKLEPASVTQIFSDLRKDAKIEERVSPHMLRHRYITLQVVSRLRSLNTSSSIGVEAITTILSRVASVSGHSSIDSMWRYVDWAYEELEQDSRQAYPSSREAFEAADRILEAVSAGADDELLKALRIVRDILAQNNSIPVGNPSIVAHSLRGRAV